jgi:hypothetical protein
VSEAWLVGNLVRPSRRGLAASHRLESRVRPSGRGLVASHRLEFKVRPGTFRNDGLKKPVIFFPMIYKQFGLFYLSLFITPEQSQCHTLNVHLL